MKKETIIIVAVVIFVLCIGLGAYIFAGQKSPDVPAPLINPVSPPNVSIDKHDTVKIYMIGVENNNPVLKPVDIDLNTGEDPVKFTFQSMVEEVDTADLANPIPEGTKLIGLTVENELLSLNFSREFIDNFPGGSENESLLINSILKTAAQFPNIRKVKLSVDSKPVDTLGHLDLSEPLGVDMIGTEYGGES